jgi:hypothetical protein
MGASFQQIVPKTQMLEFENASQGEQLREKTFLPVVSLFSGAGGLGEGFIQAGFSAAGPPLM